MTIVVDLGQMDYGEALSFQRIAWQKRVFNDLSDMLFFVEHPPTYTVGRSGGAEHLKVSKAYLIEKGINIYEVERGGSITFHGFGQIVVYPIVHMAKYNNDLCFYFNQLEELIIKVLNKYNIKGRRCCHYPGVWVDNKKIAAIGIACKKFVVTHGFALNVNVNLTYFSAINPCGIVEYGVTSMEMQAAPCLDLEEIKKTIAQAYQEMSMDSIEYIDYKELNYLLKSS